MKKEKRKELLAAAQTRRAWFEAKLQRGDFEFEFAEGVEIKRHIKLAWEFAREVLGVTPIRIMDGTLLGDFVCNEAVIAACYQRWGFKLEPRHHLMPLWQVLDELEAWRSRPVH